MKIALLQLNPRVGDLEANADAIVEAYREACNGGAELVVSAELALTGYPPRDLLDRNDFLDACERAYERLGKVVGKVPLVLGWPRRQGDHLFNTASVLRGGHGVGHYHKIWLPTYDVFDEARYFHPGQGPHVFECAGQRIGLTVCEDIWGAEEALQKRYDLDDPLALAAEEGADLVLNLSASPYRRGKVQARRQALSSASRHYGLPIVYANQVGGNDALLFDGQSFCVWPDGTLQWAGPAFSEATVWIDPAAPSPSAQQTLSEDVQVAEALTLGIRDYFCKCGFGRAVIGLSGGIDSALTAALAVRALGPEQVLGVAMPSRYSSEGSVSDAEALAANLGIHLDIIPIERMHQAFAQALKQPFADLGRPLDGGITDENIQSRARGLLLMAYANQLGALVLSTGNKSELAVGYCTLYGDMNGGLAVLSDLYKGEVYALARHLNATMQPAPIPESTLDKPPSAELRPGQKDSDSLPDYDVLDAVLRAYVDEGLGLDEICAQGFARKMVERVTGLVDRNEYKRRQMAPGLRVSGKAFGEGRRMPIARGDWQQMG